MKKINAKIKAEFNFTGDQYDFAEMTKKIMEYIQGGEITFIFSEDKTESNEQKYATVK